MSNYDLTLDLDETFDQIEAPRIRDEYVCAVCHSNLTILFAENRSRVLIVCLEHGSVTKCGRVTRTTVSIEMERAHRRFRDACRNLPDLWGDLIPKPKPPGQNLRELGF